MILLVTSSERASECAVALHEATGHEISVAENWPRASQFLRTENYAAVVLDQYLLETEPQIADSALDQIGAAIPIHVNLGISGLSRLVREVRAAMQRGERDEVRARLSVLRRLHGQLNETVTALLLSCELALETAGVTTAGMEKLTVVHDLVNLLRKQLEGAGNLDQNKAI